MAGQLETVVREMFEAFDSKDFQKALSVFTDDVQGVDEISRKWLRGYEEMAEYFSGLESAIEDIHSEVSGAHEKIWGDVGLITCWLEQDYRLEGEDQHISAPLTFVLRQDKSEWGIALVHCIPLPEE